MEVGNGGDHSCDGHDGDAGAGPSDEVRYQFTNFEGDGFTVAELVEMERTKDERFRRVSLGAVAVVGGRHRNPRLHAASQRIDRQLPCN